VKIYIVGGRNYLMLCECRIRCKCSRCKYACVLRFHSV